MLLRNMEVVSIFMDDILKWALNPTLSNTIQLFWITDTLMSV